MLTFIQQAKMSFEMQSGPEKDVPSLTREQFNRFKVCSPDDWELMEWMLDNGIEFDSGIIEVTVDGKRKRISTSKNDFGTETQKAWSGIMEKKLPRPAKKQPPRASGYRRMELPGA